MRKLSPKKLSFHNSEKARFKEIKVNLGLKVKEILSDDNLS